MKMAIINGQSGYLCSYLKLADVWEDRRNGLTVRNLH